MKTIELLYIEMEDALIRFNRDGDSIEGFINISKKIKDFVLKNYVKHKDLSNEGLLYIHLVNVAILSGRLGVIFNIKEIDQLIIGGLLHDIGKYFMNDSILNKMSSLNFIERKIVEEHPYMGYKLLQNYLKDELILSIVRDHHKPFGDINKLTDINYAFHNKEISLPFICSITDITDAILSYRSYKEPLSVSVIKEELQFKGIINPDKILSFLI